MHMVLNSCEVMIHWKFESKARIIQNIHKITNTLPDKFNAFNFMRETAFNLLWPVLKEGFQKFHLQPQCISPLGGGYSVSSARDKPEICLHTCYSRNNACSRLHSMYAQFTGVHLQGLKNTWSTTTEITTLVNMSFDHKRTINSSPTVISTTDEAPCMYMS